jgi:hypothetical protein
MTDKPFHGKPEDGATYDENPNICDTDDLPPADIVPAQPIRPVVHVEHYERPPSKPGLIGPHRPIFKNADAGG